MELDDDMAKLETSIGVMDSLAAARMNDVIPPATSDPQERYQSFQWHKPPEMDYRDLSASAKLATALTLEGDLRQRDVIIRLLLKQLTRSNKEKYKLLEELNRYRGSDRETLYRENCILKHRIDRVTRENLTLRGLEKQRNNHRIGRTPITHKNPNVTRPTTTPNGFKSKPTN